MAYIPKQIPDDEENQFARTEPTTPTPTPQGGSSAGTGQGGVAPGVGTSTQFGSKAASLSDYLKANQPQVAEFGQDVANKLGEQYGQAKGAIDTGFQQYGEEVNKGYTPNDPNLINEAASDPSSFVKDQDKFSKFQSLWGDQYKGPENVQSWEPYKNINQTVNTAVQNADLVKDYGGLSSYLNNFMGIQGKNTPGMTTLDTALLQRSPEARSSIKSAADQFKGLGGYLNEQTEAGNAKVPQAKKAASDISTSLQNQFTGEGGIIPTLNQSYQDRLNKATEDYNLRNSLVQNAGDVPNEQMMELFGIDPNLVNRQANQYFGGQGNEMGFQQIADILKNEYGMTPNVFSSNLQQVNQPNAYNTLNPEDVTRSQALAQLVGSDIPYNAGEQIGGYAAPTLDVQKSWGDLAHQGLAKDLEFTSNIQNDSSPENQARRNIILNDFNQNDFWNDPKTFDTQNPTAKMLDIQNKYNSDPKFKQYVEVSRRSGKIPERFYELLHANSFIDRAIGFGDGGVESGNSVKTGLKTNPTTGNLIM